MDPIAWSTLARELAGTFGGACQPAFTAEPEGRQAEWWAWVDHETRQDGVSTDVLAEVGQMAQAPLVLVIYLEDPDPNRPRKGFGAGAPAPAAAPAESAKPKPTPVGAPANVPIAPKAPTGHRHKIRTTWEPMPVHTFGIGASLYSVDQHEFVAEVGADATAEKKEDARQGFYERLRRLLPNATCASWDWSRDQRPPATESPTE